MPVYVDNARRTFRRMLMCHMLADTDGELHAMADEIGVERRHFQGDHYDICLAKRALAIQHGAIEMTQREAAAMMTVWRHTGFMPPPQYAMAARAQLYASSKPAEALPCPMQPSPSPAPPRAK